MATYEDVEAFETRELLSAYRLRHHHMVQNAAYLERQLSDALAREDALKAELTSALAMVDKLNAKIDAANDLTAAVLVAKTERKSQLCTKCNLHPKNPQSATNGCEHEYAP